MAACSQRLEFNLNERYEGFETQITSLSYKSIPLNLQQQNTLYYYFVSSPLLSVPFCESKQEDQERMSKLWVVWLISTTWVVMLGNAAPSPSSPSVDCSTVIFDMLDCVPFLSDGSTQTKPTPGCCSGYQSVISVDPECICFAIKSSGDMGIKLNITKAMTLPSACGLPAPPVDCGSKLSSSSSSSFGFFS
ncbi:non-specific lipid transfer protein GPI-anchored 31-like [Tripterygium wilfordii]|uniref:non-specific lipid transfer protein GPI-anchored 31-like n=1 Tax=Tripterygium wilfordii TaxID=458696 RepID=UPI0018F7EF33|nr:non-specific lipid transfer protein GPI-anchored 31-like [Tripterygium wilfordii]